MIGTIVKSETTSKLIRRSSGSKLKLSILQIKWAESLICDSDSPIWGLSSDARCAPPLRPTVSAIGSLTYLVSKHLAKAICQPKYLEDELKHLEKAFLANGYSTKEIRRALRPSNKRKNEHGIDRDSLLIVYSYSDGPYRECPKKM